jgi:glutamate-ammonia-ligase adenylyltransferase
MGSELSISTETVPPPFDQERAHRFADEFAADGTSLLEHPRHGALIRSVAGNSPFLSRSMLKEQDFLATFLDGGPDTVLDDLESHARSVAQSEDADLAMQQLRIAKRRVALAIALADIAGAYPLERVTERLTRFADACVQGALRLLLLKEAQRSGLPEIVPERLEMTTGLVVIAMGKHGAFELNYSSDIDLVVFYDNDRFPFSHRGDKQRAAVELVKQLVKLLAETTVDGYVFRVDLRLRPDAGATQIAVSTEAAELYYESMGQNWERAAWIKARQCAGDPEAGAQFLKNMQPFIWRKHLDYAAIEDIHSIKRQIHAHAGHSRIAVLGHNIKLGRGGIREIEFFAQTQQLILGGRDPSLRNQTTIGALKALEARGHISPEATQDLRSAYRFLRTLEHRLQMIDDQQVHTLPKAPDGLDHVARFMGFQDTLQFEEELRANLGKVQGHYSRLFEQEAPLASRVGSLVFTGVEEDPETVATLARMGFERPADLSAIIRGWHHGRIRATRSARARELLTKLMPALLEALSGTVDPDAAFVHFDRFLTGLPAGVQVFSLLLANPRLLLLVAEIAGSAPRLAEYLGRHAGVLDALIDPDFLARTPTREELQTRLTDELSRSASYEAALDAARRFAKEENFRIGVQVIQGLTDAQHAGPAYAAVADTVIASLQDIVVREVEAAHGTVEGGGFAVVAQGKLGGREMTATSDLDLVFVYTHSSDAAASNGKKPLSPSAYFARAAQRFIAALTSSTAEGPLYEVDMRLRPSGNQGPVAVSLDSFVQYHRERSWTWERMALTRARVVSGPAALRSKVEAAIGEALTRPQEASIILADARSMRTKLAAQFPGRDIWDIKFAPGGLIDIEFVAQTLQLRHARRQPGVLDQNTIRALERLAAAGALSPALAETLIRAAKLEHSLTQVLRIALTGPFDASGATRGFKMLLARAGDAPDFSALEGQLADTERQVRAIFDQVIPAPGETGQR